MESRSESGIDVLKETCYSVARASEVVCILYAKVAQSVEHSTENAGVGGSIPPLGTFCCLWKRAASLKQLLTRLRTCRVFSRYRLVQQRVQQPPQA